MVSAYAGGPDDGDHVTGLGHQREVLDHRLVRLVAERHRLELHPAAVHRAGILLDRIRHLLLGVEDFEDPLGRGDPGLQQVDHRTDLRERLAELAGVLDERLHLTQ